MVWHRVPRFVQQLFPKRIWKGDASDRRVYLTFDDGPVPGATDYVLEELEKRGQKATFFMVGDNVRKHGGLAKEVASAGHRIGNHTYHHLKGWHTPNLRYLEDIRAFDDILEEKLGLQTDLFRPPYGLMKSSQAKVLLETKRIVMWDVLSGDYDPSLPADRVLGESKVHTEAGSIVLFHDQQKTKEVLPKVLPAYLDFLLEAGFQTALL
ncbi:polysaccharide deacetylase family protein [Algoriphagus sp. H41]|uniref:Polysaccharide deacetylase family protein n=1 Tax=Algoriphagus oliviformis TaxID=2811231 RepID=A0ABS3C3H4_9BACT|nr:polysaccharide deacetylase family protein [Algoriphagus oliviformis]MBN7811672.1 polysaccharide deacetylase family protein [Algoriphagus oliviformis]